MEKKTSKIINTLKMLLIVFAFSFVNTMHATTASTSANSTLSLTTTTATSFFGKKKRIKKKVVRRVRRKRGGWGHCPKVPIDGGLSILVLGAAAFGVKKLRDKK